MPESDKTRPKPKPKAKAKLQPEQASITAKKSYWLMLAAVLGVATAVFAVTLNIGLTRTAVLTASVLAVIGAMGFIRTTKSNFRTVYRAVFVFGGMSIGGFLIWAAMVYLTDAAGLATQILDSLGDQFFSVTTLAICLSTGAFVGDLISKIKFVQVRLADKLKPLD